MMEVMGVIKRLFKPKRIGRGYLLRWHLIPRNRFFNIYLHKFIGDDDDRALHDHPWWSFSIRLKGQMFEHEKGSWDSVRGWVQDNDGKTIAKFPASRFRLRRPEYAHRIELARKNKPCWTIFITGPRICEWGFHCPNGWQHWSTMTTETGETIGGCE